MNKINIVQETIGVKIDHVFPENSSMGLKLLELRLSLEDKSNFSYSKTHFHVISS